MSLYGTPRTSVQDRAEIMNTREVSGDPTTGEVIADDRACLACSYDLRGLSSDGRCPECGTPVWVTLRPLGQWDTRWTWRVRLGLALLVISYVPLGAMLALAFLPTSARMAFNSFTETNPWLIAIFFTPAALFPWAAGILLFFGEPASLVRVRSTSRRQGRTLLVAALICAIVISPAIYYLTATAGTGGLVVILLSMSAHIAYELYAAALAWRLRFFASALPHVRLRRGLTVIFVLRVLSCGFCLTAPFLLFRYAGGNSLQAFDGYRHYPSLIAATLTVPFAAMIWWKLRQGGRTTPPIYSGSS